MKVKVFRYDPAVDDAPAYETYEVEWKEHITVLEVLTNIYENHAPIACDSSCRGRVCGRCAMMLDGEPVMACYTPLKTDSDIVLEPLAGFPVIRDFIVDKRKLNTRISNISNKIRYQPMTKEEIEAPIDFALANKIKSLEWCSRCYSRVSSCPAYNNPSGSDGFVGPVGLVTLGLRFYDPNDQGDRVIEAVQNGLFTCILCGKCDSVCQADEIEHVSLYNELRAAAESRGLSPKK